MAYDDKGNFVPSDNYDVNPEQDPGFLGLNKYNANLYKPNAGSYSNPYEAEQRKQLGDYFNSLGGRTTPTAEAAQLGNANIAPAAYAGTGAMAGYNNIDQTYANQARAYQMGLLGQLQDEASGKAPSIAEAQMKAGLNNSLQQQMSMAGSMGGSSNPALAMRNLQFAGAAQQGQIAQQAGIARLQEQQMAQQQLGAMSGAVRGQDLGVAGQQAALNQQIGLANQGSLNQFSLANAGFEQQSNLANAAAKNQYGLTQGQFNQQANLANQQAQMGMYGLNQQGQTWALGQYLGMGEADRQAAMQYEQLMAQQSAQEEQLRQQAFEKNADDLGATEGGLLTGFGQFAALSDENEKTNVAPAGGGSDDLMSFLSRYQPQGQGAGAPAMPSYTQPVGAPPVSGGAASPYGNGAMTQIPRPTDEEKAASVIGGMQLGARSDGKGGSRLGGGMGGMGGMMGVGGMMGLSDEDEKDEKESAAGKLLGPLTPYTYNYKNPSAPGASPGRKLGVMAQDLEKTPYGKDAVVDTPNGKMVNFGKLIPPMLAAETDLYKRLAELEKKAGK